MALQIWEEVTPGQMRNLRGIPGSKVLLYLEIPPVLLGVPWQALRGPLRNHFYWAKRPQLHWGERSPETLWKPPLPCFLGLGHPCCTFEGMNSGYALGASSAWIVGLGASQPYFRGVFQDTLCERFRGLPVFSGTSSGKSQPYWGWVPLNREEWLGNLWPVHCDRD